MFAFYFVTWLSPTWHPSEIVHFYPAYIIYQSGHIRLSRVSTPVTGFVPVAVGCSHRYFFWSFRSSVSDQSDPEISFTPSNNVAPDTYISFRMAFWIDEKDRNEWLSEHLSRNEHELTQNIVYLEVRAIELCHFDVCKCHVSAFKVGPVHSSICSGVRDRWTRDEIMKQTYNKTHQRRRLLPNWTP